MKPGQNAGLVQYKKGLIVFGKRAFNIRKCQAFLESDFGMSAAQAEEVCLESAFNILHGNKAFCTCNKWGQSGHESSTSRCYERIAALQKAKFPTRVRAQDFA